MKVNQDELLKAISILSKNPEYIKMINDGTLPSKDKLFLHEKDEFVDPHFICNQFIVPYEDMVNKVNKKIDYLKDSWKNRPKDLKDYYLTFECYSPRAGVYIVKQLIQNISSKDHFNPPIYYSEYDFYQDSLKNNAFKHTELPEYFTDDSCEVLEDCDNIFTEVVDLFNSNDDIDSIH